MKDLEYDLVVVGGGTAGVIAAMAAGRMGAKTLIVERSGVLGGQLVSGLQVAGTKNAMGEWILGGIPMELFNKCKEIDEFTTSVFDWRQTWFLEVDPELLKVIIIETLSGANVSLLINTTVYDVVTKGDLLKALVATDGCNHYLIKASRFIDSSGDAEVACKAGAEYEHSKYMHEGHVQPVSIIFRMNEINIPRLLEFIRDNPEDIMLGENPIIEKNRVECAEEVYRQGVPVAALDCKGSLLSRAIESGEMYKTMGIYFMPVAMKRNEIALNTTRVADIDATSAEVLGEQIPGLFSQVQICAKFVRNRVPGFENAKICAISPVWGVRETRRIIGEYVLTKDDVLSARKFDDPIAKCGHHIDIHGSGTYQERIPISGGGSVDIPYRCLIPKKVENLLVAGRCISGTREALGSVRQMGTCMAEGHAAGVAAVLSIRNGVEPRNLSYSILGGELEQQGAILTGTK